MNRFEQRKQQALRDDPEFAAGYEEAGLELASILDRETTPFVQQNPISTGLSANVTLEVPDTATPFTNSAFHAMIGSPRAPRESVV